METLDEDGKEETLERKYKKLTDTAGRQEIRSPDNDKRMMDDYQNLTKMFEQVCAVTVGRHVHKPPSYDKNKHEDRLL